MRAVLLRGRQAHETTFFDLGLMEEAKAIDRVWRDAAEGEKRSRTVFAHNTLGVEEVMAAWDATEAVLGETPTVQRFVSRALTRLGAPPEPRGGVHVISLAGIDAAVKERLEAEDLSGQLRLTFELKPGKALFVHRAHPLTSVLAETLFERSLAGGDPDPATLPRCGVWATKAVDIMTTLALLRIRHRLTSRRRGAVRTLLVEEAAAVAWRGAAEASIALSGRAALAFLDAEPAGGLSPIAIERTLTAALARIRAGSVALDAYAAERAVALASDHDRLRVASQAAGATAVAPVTPVDVIGLFVLLPADV
jgi:hypothetical protein